MLFYRSLWFGQLIRSLWSWLDLTIQKIAFISNRNERTEQKKTVLIALADPLVFFTAIGSFLECQFRSETRSLQGIYQVYQSVALAPAILKTWLLASAIFGHFSTDYGTDVGKNCGC